MQYMNKIFYNISPEERRTKFKDRHAYDSALVTDLEIKPINQSQAFPLYYIPTMKTLDLVGQIAKNDMILDRLYYQLPTIAQRNFLIDLLSDELYSTNTIEGIKSSKEELVSTTREVLSQRLDKHEEISDARAKKYKFYNFLNSYSMVGRGDLRMPSKPEEIRKIYDTVVLDTIDKKDLPDGEFFRKDKVFIYKAGKEVHRGLWAAEDTEASIQSSLTRLLAFIHLDEKSHPLIKNAIFHYYFGYIHPFYDGNGRTSRFLSSLYLREDYSMLTALSLAQGCNSERGLYLRAFDSSNQLSMQGEINYFVDSFLYLLHCGQEILRENLQGKIYLLEAALAKIQADTRLDEDLKLIMSALSQVHLFGFHASMTVRDFEKITNYKEQTIRNKLNLLEEMGLIIKLSRNPFMVVINHIYLEN